MTRAARPTDGHPPDAPAPSPLRAALVWVALALVTVLLAGAFVLALPDAVERQRQGRLHRIQAVCEDALRPSPGNSVLGALPAEAPDFQLQDWANRTVSLSSLRGRVVLLNFWFTQCPPCIAEIPSLEKLVQAEKGKPFSLVTVSVDPDWETVRKFFSKGTPLTVLLDADKKVPPLYGTEKFPESFLIDRDGKILLYIVSDRDWSTPAARACIDAALE
ncbi:MAG TPA: TlpA disulfide reductase family protein [Polyangia bacterium]|jgi:thiol-disulfide isomerase/thioredoxin|nr:TlpA disulfide reductase family protein [Polyangia bacterium]